MINPYKEIRLRESLTQKQLAASLGLTPQVILRVEQGLFSRPPSQLTYYLSQLSRDNSINGGLSPQELESAYFQWVYKTRGANGTKKGGAVAQARKLLQLIPGGIWRPDWVDFRRNYLGLSVAATAKLLVIQISILQDFERTGRNAQQIQDILLEWGIATDEINWRVANKLARNDDRQ